MADAVHEMRSPLALAREARESDRIEYVSGYVYVVTYTCQKEVLIAVFIMKRIISFPNRIASRRLTSRHCE